MALSHKYTVVVTHEDLERCASNPDEMSEMAYKLASLVSERFLFDVMAESLSKREWNDYGDGVLESCSVTALKNEVTD